LILTAAGWLGAPVLAADLETGFVHPPASARPWVWYRVCGYFSKAGITADLESLAKQGFGGLTVDISDGGPLVSANIKSNMAFLSPEFSDHLFFILEEAKRLGLEVPIMPLNGWSAAGGNWIKPEHREHVLAWDEVVVTGPGQQKISLQPPLSEGAFFKDIVTLAIPIERLPTESSFRKAKPKVRADTVKPGTPEGNWNASADMVIDGNPGSFIRSRRMPVARNRPLPLPSTSRLPPSRSMCIPADPTSERFQTRDSASKSPTMARRSGRSTPLIPRRCSKVDPAPSAFGPRGYEANKYSKAATEDFLSGFFEKIVADSRAKEYLGSTLVGFHLDSWECSAHLWSDDIPGYWDAHMPYPLEPWLPALLGFTVGTPAETRRFLWDYRRVRADMIANQNYRVIQERAHDHSVRPLPQRLALCRLSRSAFCAELAAGRATREGRSRQHLGEPAHWRSEPAEIRARELDCHQSAHRALPLATGRPAGPRCPENVRTDQVAERVV